MIFMQKQSLEVHYRTVAGIYIKKSMAFAFVRTIITSL